MTHIPVICRLGIKTGPALAFSSGVPGPVHRQLDAWSLQSRVRDLWRWQCELGECVSGLWSWAISSAKWGYPMWWHYYEVFFSFLLLPTLYLAEMVSHDMEMGLSLMLGPTEVMPWLTVECTVSSDEESGQRCEQLPSAQWCHQEKSGYCCGWLVCRVGVSQHLAVQPRLGLN